MRASKDGRHDRLRDGDDRVLRPRRSRNFYRDVLTLHIGTDAAPDWVDFEMSEVRGWA